MKLLDELREEHALIEQVVGSWWAWAESGGREADAYLRFFRLYAGRFHHAREEQVLFPALVRELGLPADRGPARVLLEDHASMAAQLDAIEADLAASRPARAGVLAYGQALLAHIDAENSVLLPECEDRFRRANVAELPGREADPEELAARLEGVRLLAAHPPRELPGALRGDGCTACAAYGSRCDGIEQEWWSDDEWEDFFERSR